MSSAKQKIQLLRDPVLASKSTPEQRYWRSYGNTQLVKEHNAVTHIAFNPISPHDFAVTSSARIQVFSSKTRQVTKTFLRFKETAYSGEYRHDGKLFVAGDSSGLVQVFDAQNPRTLLVTVQASLYPVHVTQFHPHVSSQMLAASDDKTAKLYDISQTQAPLFEFAEHDDYIRTASFVRDQPSLVATGCYDGHLRVFDTRAGTSPVLSFDHGAPVESVLSLNQTTLVSAGGTNVRVWDLPSKKQVKSMSNFTKTVTTLATAGDRSLLAGSLDGHVKVYDMLQLHWEVKFGWKFGAGVLSCGVSPNGKHFVAGLASGLLLIRTRKSEKTASKGPEKKEKLAAFARMMRGSDYHGEHEDRIIADGPKTAKKQHKYERLLGSFRWGEAFDLAFQPGVPKDVSLTILGELKKLGKIRVALLGRDEASLEPFFAWSVKNLDDIRCVDILVDYLGAALDQYGELAEDSILMEELLVQLKGVVREEIEKSKEAGKLQGMLELLIN